jgi:hypothetical protein
LVVRDDTDLLRSLLTNELSTPADPDCILFGPSQWEAAIGMSAHIRQVTRSAVPAGATDGVVTGGGP